MDKAGLVTSVRRGVYRITDAGKKVLVEKPQRLYKEYLERFEPFRAFLILRHPDEGAQEGGERRASDHGTDSAQTPEEQLEAAYKRIRQRAESEVLQAVMSASPQFFENLVVELLVKMGYGGLVPGAGEVSGQPPREAGPAGSLHYDLDVLQGRLRLRWPDRVEDHPHRRAVARGADG